MPRQRWRPRVLAALALEVENDPPAAAEHVTEAPRRRSRGIRHPRLAGDLAYALERFPAAVALYQGAPRSRSSAPPASHTPGTGLHRRRSAAPPRLPPSGRLWNVARRPLDLGLTKIMQGDFAAAQQIIDRRCRQRRESSRNSTGRCCVTPKARSRASVHCSSVSRPRTVNPRRCASRSCTPSVVDVDAAFDGWRPARAQTDAAAG